MTRVQESSVEIQFRLTIDGGIYTWTDEVGRNREGHRDEVGEVS